MAFLSLLAVVILALFVDRGPALGGGNSKHGHLGLLLAGFRRFRISILRTAY